MIPASIAERSTRLAQALVEAGADAVVVGSTARRLRGADDVVPRDLDLVVDPGRVGALRDALAVVGAAGRIAASGGHVVTGWGEVDVFVGPVPRAVSVAVGDVLLAVHDG